MCRLASGSLRGLLDYTNLRLEKWPCQPIDYALPNILMELSDLVKQSGGQSAFARKCGCTRQEIWRILDGRRKLGPAMAWRIFNATGERLGPYAKDQS